jgi:peptide/nickel transport system ATP-binding protein
VPAELLELRNVSKVYAGRPVLRGVTFSIRSGEMFALVGPSGSGKTTLARCIAGFESPDAGEIIRPAQIQLVPQQPAASLNPRFTAAEIVEEPLVIQRRPRAGAAIKAMELVGLPPAALSKRAREFSGGENQRLAIARALVVEPKLLILDESFAGLDWRTQDQMSALLQGLHDRLGLACILISHDLERVAALADRLAVIDEGAIVDDGPTESVLSAPTHPLTRKLLAAAHVLNPNWSVR